jgi:hypothetical protein
VNKLAASATTTAVDGALVVEKAGAAQGLALAADITFGAAAVAALVSGMLIPLTDFRGLREEVQ